MTGEDADNTESGSTGESGETEITASLGMMQLSVTTDEGVDAARETFEEVWTNRVDEIEESEANTLRQELEPDDSGLVRLG